MAHSPRVLRFGVGGVLLGATLGATACDRGGEAKPTDAEDPKAEDGEPEPERPMVNEGPEETGDAAVDEGADGTDEDEPEDELDDGSADAGRAIEPRTNVGRMPKPEAPPPMPETNVGREGDPTKDAIETP